MVKYVLASLTSKKFSLSMFLRLGNAIGLILPFVFYVAILRLQLPYVSGWGEFLNLGVLIIASPALIWAYRCSGWGGAYVSLGLTLGLFAIPLSLMWSSVLHNYSVVGGLLPWSDASKYYMEASRLLEGFLFTDWGGRRPLFSGMFAVFLGLTGQNLQWTIAILGAINATACYLVTREIQRTHGTLVAIIVLALLYLFCCTYVIGLALSESLGLAMGNIAFAVFWRGSWNGQQRTIWLGLLLLTLALCARSGAYLVLPLLIVTGAWYFRKENRPSWNFLGMALGTVALGFLINAIVSSFVVVPGAVSNANFSSTLYGLAVGGKGWEQVKLDYPSFNVEAGNPAINAKDIYILTFQIILHHPSGFLIGLVKGWIYFFAQSFDFISGVPVVLRQLPLWKLAALMVGQGVLWLFSALGFVGCWQRRFSQGYLLLSAAALGIFASAPFLAMDGGARVFAATLPFSIALIAVGCHMALTKIKWAAGLNVPLDRSSSTATLSFGCILTLLVILGPLIIRVYSKPSTFMEIPCPPNQEAIFVRLTSGSSIKLVEDSVGKNSRLPNIRLNDFRVSNPAPGGLEFTDHLISLSTNTSLFNALNLKTGRNIWLAIPTPLLPQKLGHVAICGVLLVEKNYLLYNVTSVSSGVVNK